MTSGVSDEAALKEAVKEALIDALHEQRELLYEIFSEVLEDYALAASIGEGRDSEPVSREEIMETLRKSS